MPCRDTSGSLGDGKSGFHGQNGTVHKSGWKDLLSGKSPIKSGSVKTRLSKIGTVMFLLGEERRPLKSAGLAVLGASLVLVGSTLIAWGAETKPGASLKLVASGLVSPTGLTSLDATSGRLLITDQVGTIHVLTKEGALLEKPFLDLRDRMAEVKNGFDERGLLGLALHPKFNSNRKFYVVYNAPLRKGAETNWDSTLHLSEFKVSERNSTQADAASERVLLEIDKPYFNHNGGAIVFGPDGYLYMAVGDGGNANDTGHGHSPQGNGQDTRQLLGKILRLDVDHGDKYSIPSDNPFAKGGGRPEIYAYGLRNPWRISFDRGGSHELFAADVGQDLFEEVDLIVKGGNYGWNIREGFHGFDPKDSRHPPEASPKVGADGQPLLDPIFEYKSFKAFPKDPEGLGTSVTGGFVYRGKALPELSGRYVFADWSRNFAVADGFIYVASRPSSDAVKKWSIEPLDLTSHPKGKLRAFVVSLGEDAEGELYVMTNNSNQLIGQTGKVYKLVREP